jgi:uncharacterized protein YjbJ (UPF0337 family)
MSFIDKLKNKGEHVTGNAKEQVGHAKGDDRLEAEGKNDQSKANLKDAGEKVKDATGSVKDAGAKVKDAIKH